MHHRILRSGFGRWLALFGVGLSVWACTGGGSEESKKRGAYPPGSLEAKGEQVFRTQKCGRCHDQVKGRSSMGAPLEGIFNTEVQFEDGRKAVRDEGYLRRSILSPRADVVKGFRPVMPEPKALSADDLDALVAYLKSLPASS